MLWHLDLQNEFLNFIFKLPVYLQLLMYVNHGVISCNWLLKLHQSLYGLRNASKIWHHDLTNVLIILGSSDLELALCVYLKLGVVAAFRVDEILIFAKKKEEISIFEEKLRKSYKLKNVLVQGLTGQVERALHYGNQSWSRNCFRKLACKMPKQRILQWL